MRLRGRRGGRARRRGALGADRRGDLGLDAAEMTGQLLLRGGALVLGQGRDIALGGAFQDRTRLAIESGCDVVLHCNGDLGEMMQVAGAVPALAGEAERRAEAALARVCQPWGL